MKITMHDVRFNINADTAKHDGVMYKLSSTITVNIPDHILVQGKQMVLNGRPLTSATKQSIS